MIRPRLRRFAAITATLAAAGAMLVACGDEEKSSIDYLVDARVTDYNVNTRDGYADGALMAFTRVLPGFSFIGPSGQIVADRDIGTATLTEESPMTVRYQFNPDAVYSDGRPMVCDDLLLAATAMSGRTPGFDAATNAGYRDIANVDCTRGAREATVTFDRDAQPEDWRSLFGAGTLLPAHVVAKLAGVPDVVGPIRGRDKAALAKIAKAWSTGFTVKPGDPIDPEKFVAAGPYRLEGYSTDRGLRLVANDKWWGQSPALGDVTVWPRGTDGDKALADGEIDVIDSSDTVAADKVADRTTPTDVDRSAARDAAPLAVTELVFAARGAGADPALRRALAMCMPRDRLARAHGSNGIVWNLRSASPADSLGPSLNAQYGRRYPRADVPRAKTVVDGRAAAPDGSRTKPTIRIGYPAGDTEFAAVVATIKESCTRAGITVRDVAAPDFSVAALGRGADAMLLAGDTFAAAGTATGIPALFSLYPGDPLNFSGSGDAVARRSITELAGTRSDSTRLPLLRTVETAAWDDLATIPLYGAVRGRESVASVTHAVPGMGRSGTGWNMDRWGRSE